MIKYMTRVINACPDNFDANSVSSLFYGIQNFDSEHPEVGSSHNIIVTHTVQDFYYLTVKMIYYLTPCLYDG